MQIGVVTPGNVNIGIAEETDLLAAWTDVDDDVLSDLHEVLCNAADHPVERDDHDDRNSLLRLERCKALHGLREPAGPSVRRVFRGEVNHGYGITRCRSEW